ncbi:Fis family transcriptional regulator [Caballeronia choica]|uniref:Fis family transcriptional regulator n=2 Tax=Caballeronia choica TaxID=326476 RepID=A0A158L6A8_9BURK|nr:Fis family transcriptional regulator [Caballeronia choica]
MPSAAQTFAPHEKLMMLPLAPAIANEISLDYHLRLEMIRIGHGNEYHLGSVTQAVLTAMMLSQTSGANVRKGLFAEAKAAVVRCRRTGLETGIWVVDSEAYELFGEILTLFDQQLAVVPLVEFASAHERLEKVLERSHARRQKSAPLGRPPVCG